MESGDHETARALAHAPGGSWVRGKTIKQVAEEQGRRLSPAAHENLQALRTTQLHFERLEEQAMAWLNGLVK